MEIRKALELLRRYLDEIAYLRTLHHSDNQVELWKNKVDQVVKAAFRRVSEEYGWLPSPGFWSPTGNYQEDHLLELDNYELGIEKILQKHKILDEAEQSLPEEAVYPSDKPYDAYKHIKTIISAASQKLIIVDPYVDSTLFDLLENVQPGIQIQVLTRDMKGDFQLAGQKFKEQYEKAQQGSLEVRKESGNFHDRFIIADDKFFHLGASIKDAGKKLFAINEIQNSCNKKVLMENISKSRDTASKVL